MTTDSIVNAGGDLPKLQSAFSGFWEQKILVAVESWATVAPVTQAIVVVSWNIWGKYTISYVTVILIFSSVYYVPNKNSKVGQKTSNYLMYNKSNIILYVHIVLYSIGILVAWSINSSKMNEL